MNGTGPGAKPYGRSKNPDIRTLIVDEKGKLIKNPNAAIQRAKINPNESDQSYDYFKRVASSDNEDANAIDKAAETASSKRYGVGGVWKILY